MPYKRHDPIDIREMDRTRYDGHHSICQILRDIFHMTDNEEIKLKCRIAMNMAKSMHNKLKKYKAEKEKVEGGQNASRIESIKEIGGVSTSPS